MPVASSSFSSATNASLPVSPPPRNDAAGRANKPAPLVVLQSLRSRNSAVAEAHQAFSKEVAAYLFPAGNHYTGLEKLHRAASAFMTALRHAENVSPESRGALDALITESRKDLPAQNLQNHAGLSLLLERLQTATQKYVARNASERTFQIEDAPAILAALEDYWDKLHAEPLHRHKGMSRILPQQDASATSLRTTADLHVQIRNGLASTSGKTTGNRETPAENASRSTHPSTVSRHATPHATPSSSRPEARIEPTVPLPAQESLRQPAEAEQADVAMDVENLLAPPSYEEQPQPTDVEGHFVPMSQEEQEHADQLLHNLQHTGRYASLAGAVISLRNAMFPSTKELRQLKELLGKQTLPHRELREYVLDKLLDNIPTNPDFNINDRERLIRLYQRYLSPNQLDTGRYRHAPVVLQARDNNSGTINQQKLVSDAALMRILPKLVNAMSRASEQAEVIVDIAIHNLQRLQTENPWGHAILLSKLAASRGRRNLYRVQKEKLDAAILQGVQFLTGQLAPGAADSAADLLDALERARYVRTRLTGRESLDGTEAFRQLAAACGNPDIPWDRQQPPEPPTPPYSTAP